MQRHSSRARLLASTVFAGVAVLGLAAAQPALSQETSSAAAAGDSQQAVQEVVVTGSRIRRAADDTTAPVTMINQQDFADRGYINAGQALNDITANTPSLPTADGSGNASGNGQTFPNLFNLGAGRTLTLVDGHRFINSSPGGDQTMNNQIVPTGVDTNIIPTGLVERVDVVEAGGAAVYGSDAIAGVVNYVLKKNFEGATLDMQAGISGRGDYPEDKISATFGKNFDDGKGNIAADIEWNQTRPLLDKDRPSSDLARTASGLTVINNTTFWEFNQNGVIFAPAPAPVGGFIKGQFAPNGQSIIPYNQGAVAGIPFASGGDGTSYRDLAALETGVRDITGTVLGHYDFSPHLKISGSLFYGDTRGEDPLGSQGQSNTVLNSASTGSGVIAFTKANPFLTAADVAGITAVDPAFGGGAPAFLSKFFDDLLPTRAFIDETKYYRGLISIDGDFDALNRNFYYNVSYSHAEVDGTQKGYGVNTANFNNAVNATTNGAGQIVCAINATTVTNSACAPLNPFGIGNISQAARNYVVVPVGQDYRNIEDDLLATVGGDVASLPAGKVKFSLGFEHRSESTSFSPDQANQLGLIGDGTPTLATHGSYDTNEYSAELLIPILGPGFSLPLAEKLEFSGQYRLVDNSLAGQEDVWGLGLRWQIVDGLTVRASRSQNFRAPTLDQLLAPSSTTLSSLGGGDPCDNRYIGTGPNPAVQMANCKALFAAHPSYGSLAAFQDPSVNFDNAEITSGGNRDLQNEVSETTTYGVVYQPKWLPGQLTIDIDRIEIDLKEGITALTPSQFMFSCYDSPNASNAACNEFTRDPTTGFVTAAQSTTFNAASVTYHGEELNVDYRFPVSWIVRRPDWGMLDLQVEATHNESLRTNIAGALTQVVGTIVDPRWVSRFDIRYSRGPLRVTYQAFYLPSAYAAQGASALNNPVPVVASNLRHDISATYDFGRFQFRGGITNFTDEKPSFPTLNYGDIIGREFFIGLKAHY
jgi:iron complex outermembrane receptor protein